ncbi:MAG: sugar nucleotide-binding protein [Candidatus Limiplasma sp.]|nr:sugar nucleotide-binding protein [Candidatus Limiplasma sp.]MEA5146592.1 sugar nucleotide-binding protein [Candidatus Limiplasma sp.]
MAVTYLITGANGFCGSRAAQTLARHGTVVALSRQELDITDADACMRMVALHQPRYVVHTAAMADMQACELDPYGSQAINVQGARHMAVACRENGARLIHFSTDQVYSGMLQGAPHRETEPLAPTSVYGRQKCEAEQHIAHILPDAVVLRLTWMYDFPMRCHRTNRNILRLCQHALACGVPITLASQTARGITYVHEVIDNLLPISQAPGGVYNYGSAGDVTPYRLACEVLRNMQAEHRIPELLIPMQEAPGTLADLCMDNSKATEVGACFATTSEGMARAFREYDLL